MVVVVEIFTRWCVLTNLAFIYYTKPGHGKSDIRGGFDIAGTEFREGWDQDRTPPTPHVFTILTAERNFYFCADTFHMLEQWQDAFNTAMRGPGDEPGPDPGPQQRVDGEGLAVGPRCAHPPACLCHSVTHVHSLRGLLCCCFCVRSYVRVGGGGGRDGAVVWVVHPFIDDGSTLVLGLGCIYSESVMVVVVSVHDGKRINIRVPEEKVEG